MRYVDDLTDAVRSQLARAYGLRDRLGAGLRSRLREGYGVDDLRHDARAGLAVALVSLPLALALANAIGIPPQHGLAGAIVAGVVCALLGGSRWQITGPTAALVVILHPIALRHGLGGLLVAGGLAGALLVLMGLAGLGRWMQFIPHPVTTGLTAGVAVVLALLQLPDALGLTLETRPDGTVELLGALWAARATVSGADAAIAAATLLALALAPRVLRRAPAPLIALVVVALGAALALHLLDGLTVHTLGTRFTTVIDGETVRGVPPLPPLPVVPWRLGDASGAAFAIDYALVRELLPAAFAIAVLAAIESLTSAVVADGLAGSKHDPDAELIALGLGNLVCPFFGGMACAGAVGRTAANLRAGARSPLAAGFQAVVLIAITIALAPLFAHVPLAGLAAVLLAVAASTFEARHVLRLLRIAPRSDVVVLVTCFALTVLFDLILAVSVGVVLAALLFMRRMAVLTRITLDDDRARRLDVPPGIKLYDIAGPMFFGAANLAMETLGAVDRSAHTVILAMDKVAVMDATGLVAFESTLDRLGRSGRMVILAAVPPEPAALFERAGIKRVPGRLAFAPDLETAISMAIVHAAARPS